MRGSPLMATRAWPACTCSRRRAARAGGGRAELVTGERNEGRRKTEERGFGGRRKKMWLPAPTGLPSKGAREGATWPPGSSTQSHVSSSLNVSKNII
jgi:hypothetical protein